MGKQKDQFIAIQNLIRYVEYELNSLEIEGDEKQNFLHCLSNEIAMFNKNTLEPFHKIRVH